MMETKITIVRFTLIGVTLGCESQGIQYFTSLMSAAVVHFVTSKIEGRCGTCGVEYEDDSLPHPDAMNWNQMPWVAAIQEKFYSSVTTGPTGTVAGGTVTEKHFTGTLVSKEYVVTAAKIIYTGFKIYKDKKLKGYEKNLKVILGATWRIYDQDIYRDPKEAFTDPDMGVLSVEHVSIHPSYEKGGVGEGDKGFDVALLRLKTPITEHSPPLNAGSGYAYRPICLAVPGVSGQFVFQCPGCQESSLVGTERQTTRETRKKKEASIIERNPANVLKFKNSFKTSVTR